MRQDTIQVNAPRGMRDFYPQDLSIRNTLFSFFQKAALSFGFEQYDAPVVENLSLLIRKAGEEIVDQIYTFRDKSNRELALRPEMTPSLVRLVLQKYGNLKFPLKWFSIPQCFRYERMSQGRKREHYQWNCDIIGEPSVIAEIELLSVAITALNSMGLRHTDICIHINNRQLILDLLDHFGFNMSHFTTACLVLDKRGKISDAAIKDMLTEAGLDTRDIQAIFDILKFSSLAAIEAVLKESSKGLKELKRFFELAKSYNIHDYLSFDISVVRGLSYYTGIVFECFDRAGKFRAVFGGGRYDKLFKELGDIELPAVGFGFGDVVILDVCEAAGKSLHSDYSLDYYIAYTNKDYLDKAIKLSRALRKQGLVVSMAFQESKFKKALKIAHEKQADQLLLLDERELMENKVLIKDLSSGSQKLENIGNYLS